MGLMWHIDRCRNAVLPGARWPVRVGGALIGWALPGVAALLPATMEDKAGLDRAAGGLAAAGVFRPRGEALDVRATLDGPVLGQVDRAAFPVLGLLAWGVHLNGLVRREDGLHLWVARRAADKLLDPGKLDHLVAGAVAAGMTVEETLLKEGAEEAGLSPALLGAARRVGTISYAMERPEGLRRDALACFDVELPEAWRPAAVDGEVAGFELWPVRAVLAEVRAGDGFKFNVNLVLIGLFLRLGLVEAPEAERLREALGRPGW